MRSALLLALALGGCGEPVELDVAEPPPESEPPATVPPSNTPLEPAAGVNGPVDSGPFDVAAYETSVWPALQRSCLGGAACHGGYESAAGGGLRLHEVPAGPQQHFENLLRVRAYTNLADPPYSKLLLEGLAVSTHGGGSLFTEADPDYIAMLSWIEDAAAAQGGGAATPPAPINTPEPGCALPAVENNRYDYAVFARDIQPGFNADCSSAVCHGGDQGGGLVLTVTEDAESCDSIRNFFVTQRFAFPGNVEASPLLLKPLYDAHTGGSIYTGEEDPRYQALRDWILGVGAEQQDEGVAEVPQELFDYNRFQSEVAPLLLDPASPHNCADRSCHGSDELAARGDLFLIASPELGSNEMASNFHAVAAFADAEAPSASALLTKAAGAGGHRIVLRPEDPAYDAVLDWIYRARGGDRLDPVYYAEQVQPVFDDPTAVAADNQRLTCATVGGCHGTYQPAQGPQNRSRFGLIPAATGLAELRHNYEQSAAMVRLRAPERSPLILQPLAVAEGGVYHSGGDNWAQGDVWHQRVQRWVQGMQPSEEGYVRDWLVLDAVDAGGQGLAADWLGETAPSYGTSVAGAQWGARVEGGDYVELDGEGLHHAATWLVNETGGELEVDVFFGAAAYGEVWLEGERVLADRDAASPEPGALAVAPRLILKPGANRVLVKVLGGDEGSGFYFRVRDRAEAGLAGVSVRLGGVGGGAAFGGGGGGGGGGVEIERPQDRLDRGVFEAQVLPALAAGSCGTGGGCHQERAGGFYFNPDYAGDAAEVDRIWDRLSPRAVNLQSPAESTLLTKPLANNGVNHAGGKAWASSNAAGYATIEAWIRAAQ